MRAKNLLLVICISAVTAFASVWGIGKLKQQEDGPFTYAQETGKIPANYAGFFDGNPDQKGYPVDFTNAAQAATPAVVHIKTKINARTVQGQKRRSPFADLFGDDDPFGDFFGGGGGSMQIPEQRASGSGVVVTADGYIVTNNHVIENADEINVTLPNKRSYKAELVGADPSSDLAVLKIPATNLPFLVWGNSDEVKLGQWVLAIGYPWTLDVTVTAGIVSAKARSLGLNAQKSNSPIESFIQTDAAVNQGNSGGALVDTDGKLIGINAAIASKTGAYAGYSYAIPVNLVKKIVGDLTKFGAVQRAYLGIEYIDESRLAQLPEEEVKKLNIDPEQGIYVNNVPANGAASGAGLQKGDYITAINGVKVTSGSEMVEQVANYKPGDKVSVSYRRNGKDLNTNVTLRNNRGTYDVVKGASETSLDEKLGGELVNLDEKLAKKYNVPASGVHVKAITGNPLKNSRMQEGFVITSVNGSTPIKTLEDLKKALTNNRGILRLEGFYLGFDGSYGYPLNLNSSDDTTNQ